MANREIEVVLDEPLAASVEGAVRSGEFESAQDVVLAALELWRRERADYAEELARFRAEIDEAMNDSGPYLTIDEVSGRISIGDARMKRLEVVFGKSALRDLDGMEDRIARESASLPIARRYCDRILEACHRIGDAPEGSPLRDDVRPGLRLRSFERRLIISYRIEGARVVIFRIIDGRRNYRRILSAGGA